MANITLIGAGSYVFTRNLCNDILLTPALQDCSITLMDIDPVRLAWARDLVQALIDQRKLKARVEATTDRRESVMGADYVITTFQQGGLPAYELDIDIPRKFGVEQCVGDTLGPGGVFRALRTIPVLLDLCDEMDEVAPEALLLNYVNPMAANCWGVSAGSGRPYVGLCHSVQGTSEMLARWAGAPYEEVNFVCAGINHQAFFLEFRRGEEDLYPRLREVIERLDAMGIRDSNLARIWRDVQEERVDPEQGPRRKIEALMGVDPDESDPDVIERVLVDARRLGLGAMEELAADVGSSGGVREVFSADQLTEHARRNGFAAAFDDAVQLADALTDAGIIGATAPVADRRAIETKCGAGPPLAHVMHFAHVSDSLPSSGGRHHFREVTSFRIALSSIVSASSFFSFAFSSSSERSRLASETSRPPNFDFHL